MYGILSTVSVDCSFHKGSYLQLYETEASEGLQVTCQCAGFVIFTRLVIKGMGNKTAYLERSSRADRMATKKQHVYPKHVKATKRRIKEEKTEKRDFVASVCSFAFYTKSLQFEPKLYRATWK